MRTDELLDFLSLEAEPAALPDYKMMAMFGALATASLFVLSLFFIDVMSIRADYFLHITSPMVLIKQVIPLALALLFIRNLREICAPEAFVNRQLIGALPFLAIMAGLFIYMYLQTPKEALAMEIVGKSQMRCLIMIPVLSLPGLGVLLYALKSGAPADPRLAGLYAGLLAGAIGCFAYAFACDQDSPLFFALWYSTGVAMSGFLGAVLGSRFLRW